MARRKGGVIKFADELCLLIVELRSRKLWIEPDISFPLLVRWRAPLYVALGRLCKEREEYSPLGRRVVDALDKLRIVGMRSHVAEWFARGY